VFCARQPLGHISINVNNINTNIEYLTLNYTYNRNLTVEQSINTPKPHTIEHIFYALYFSTNDHKFIIICLLLINYNS